MGEPQNTTILIVFGPLDCCRGLRKFGLKTFMAVNCMQFVDFDTNGLYKDTKITSIYRFFLPPSSRPRYLVRSNTYRDSVAGHLVFSLDFLQGVYRCLRLNHAAIPRRSFYGCHCWHQRAYLLTS